MIAEVFLSFSSIFVRLHILLRSNFTPPYLTLQAPTPLTTLQLHPHLPRCPYTFNSSFLHTCDGTARGPADNCMNWGYYNTHYYSYAGTHLSTASRTHQHHHHHHHHYYHYQHNILASGIEGREAFKLYSSFL